MADLKIKSAEESTYDQISLGEVMLREGNSSGLPFLSERMP